MQVIIKKKLTIEEHMVEQAKMVEQADLAHKIHKESFRPWMHGYPVKVWYDEEGTLCVKYESGKWWHYNLDKEEPEWW